MKAAMAPSPSVPCPDCGAPLEVALDVQVEVRLTKRASGGYGIGAVRQSPAGVRAHLLHAHCEDGKLYLGEPNVDDESQADGKVVFCSRRPACEFIGTVTEEGIE
jgi:hypothetical protein